MTSPVRSSVLRAPASLFPRSIGTMTRVGGTATQIRTGVSHLTLNPTGGAWSTTTPGSSFDSRSSTVPRRRPPRCRAGCRGLRIAPDQLWNGRTGDGRRHRDPDVDLRSALDLCARSRLLRNNRSLSDINRPVADRAGDGIRTREPSLEFADISSTEIRNDARRRRLLRVAVVDRNRDEHGDLRSARHLGVRMSATARARNRAADPIHAS